MPSKCPNCGAKGELNTDLSAGTVTCFACYAIVEQGILVNEVGFAEGSGGRVHVQGAFVSHNSTGIGGIRGKNNAESSEQVKAVGRERIALLVRQMGINFNVKNSASRLFDLAIGVRFNRGRRSEYVIASCLYLASRLKKETFMLIDFSERLRINVYDLGATYLKLRTALNLNEPMPEVDPAIYNIRFAHNLSFGPKTAAVAADASRLVRRFRADWMTQGRRPAGVCGACLVIASRMNNFLRTPEEVAQAVKVSPSTIRKRLVEFAQTDMAGKTVKEWREMRDEDLDVGGEELPPVIKAARLKAEMVRIEALRKEQEEAEEAEQGGVEGEGSTAGRKKMKHGGMWSGAVDDEGDSARDLDGLLQAAAMEYGPGADDEEDPEDPDLGMLEKSDFIDELRGVRQESVAEREERIADARHFKRQNKAALAVESQDISEDVVEEEEEEVGEEEKGEEEVEPLLEGDRADGSDAEDQGEEDNQLKKRRKPFADWDDREAVVQHLGNVYFAEDTRHLQLTPAQLKARVEAWLGDRDAQHVVQSLESVKRARREAETYMKTVRMEDMGFEDEEDQELDRVYMMSEEIKLARARMWLSLNGKWLEQNKERQERLVAYNKAHGIDPNKPKPKRKRAAPHRGAYKSARAAIEGIAVQKKFSARVNYDVLRGMGIEGDALNGLETMGDDKDDEKGNDEYEDEKGDGELFTGHEEYDPYNNDNYGEEDDYDYEE